MQKLVKFFTIFFLCAYASAPLAVHGAVYERYVKEIVNAFAKDVQKEYSLLCVGSGGKMPRDVEEIYIRFHADQKTTIEEAREMIVALKTKLVDRVNAHEKIRPFLHEYPFTLRGADITIIFHKPKSASYYLDGSVALVCSAKLGKNIAYQGAELQKKTIFGMIDTVRNTVAPDRVEEDEVFIPLLEEPYEEAVRIVQEKRQKGDGKTG